MWDTVGALGDPRLVGRIFEDAHHHKVSNLPAIVSHAVHALAIDERRKLFRPALWPSRAREHQRMEQRWFVGAHANVGGGYDKDGLFLRPLQWIQEHAARQGLEFSGRIRSLSPVFDTSFPRDPLNEIGYGSYLLTQSLPPRPLHYAGRRDEGGVGLHRDREMGLEHQLQARCTSESAGRRRAVRSISRAAPEDVYTPALLPNSPSQRNWITVPDPGFSLRVKLPEQI